MSSSIAYKRFRKGDHCTEEGCRAKRYYEQDGKRYCERGHEQAGIREVAADEDDWNNAGGTTRKKREKAQKIQIVYSGKEATHLYLHCYQLILRKQLHWLVTTKKLPLEIETIVRELWHWRVRILWPDKEDEADWASTVGWSTSDEDTDTGGQSQSRASGSRRSKAGNDNGRMPKLIDTLAMCYLGCLLRRLPIGIGELCGWVMDGQMIYSRAIMEIPPDIRRHLPAHYYAALEVRSPLKGMSLHKAVLGMVEFYNTHLEMVCPTLNHPLLLHKHLQALALPTQHIATILSIDFSWQVLHKRNYGYLNYPEIELMSVLVIATKLSQPFDDIVRLPEDESDPTLLKIDWRLWRQRMAEKPTEGLRRGEEVFVDDSDVLAMSGEKIDCYLDWYQRTWVVEDQPAKMPETILDPFPSKPLPPLQPIADDMDGRILRLKDIVTGLVIQETLPFEEGENVRRPGELYKRYRNVDELPENAKAFYDLAGTRQRSSRDGRAAAKMASSTKKEQSEGRARLVRFGLKQIKTGAQYSINQPPSSNTCRAAVYLVLPAASTHSTTTDAPRARVPPIKRCMIHKSFMMVKVVSSRTQQEEAMPIYALVPRQIFCTLSEKRNKQLEISQHGSRSRLQWMILLSREKKLAT